MAAPLPLVKEEASSGYECCWEGINFLKSCPQPLAVIVIAGRYRSGKSFLLNRGVLQLTPQNGFHTGNTVNACTKGIWVHPELMNVSSSLQALVLDTEGTGSMEGSPAQDAKLVCVALSLASLFIYNSAGALDEAAFSEIGVIAHAAEQLQESNAGAWRAPGLIWALRDFSLRLVSPTGEAIQPNDYLERCLGDSEKGASRALVRACFTERSLVPFVRPVADEEQLGLLNSLPAESLRPEFLAQLATFRARIQSLASVKQIECVDATGPALAHLCERVVEAVNSGLSPKVVDSLGFLLEEKLAKSVSAALETLAADAQALSAQLPRCTEEVALPKPGAPAALTRYPEFLLRFSEATEVEWNKLNNVVRQKNQREQQKWLRDFLQACEAKPSSAENEFTAFLRVGRKHLGVEQAYEAAGLVFETCTEALRTASALRTNSWRRCENEMREAEATIGLQAEQSRAEVESLLMERSMADTSTHYEDSVKAREHDIRGLVKELDKANAAELHALHEEQVWSCEWRACCESGISTDDAAATERMEALVAQVEATSQQHTNRLQRSLHQHEEQEQQRLTTARNEMLQMVSRAEVEFRTKLACEASQLTAAESSAQKMRAAAEKNEEVAAHSQAGREADAQAHRRNLAEVKRQHVELLAERTRIIREFHVEQQEELSRTRTQFLECERAKIRLQIENDTAHRSLQLQENGVEQLVLARTEARSVKKSLSRVESSERTAAALLDASRHQAAQAQEHLREQETSYAATLRERDYRIAVLEVQLSSLRAKAE